MPDLTSVHLKIGTALEHLLKLDEAIGAYLDTDPMDIVREIDDRHPGRVVLSLQLKKPPPVTLSAMIGDCIQNLRSALDHLAVQLVRANGGSPRRGPGGTQFPILIEGPPAGKSLQVRGGLSSGALDAVGRLQPYQRRDAENHPLAVLNRLSNLDKHHDLVVSVAQSVHTRAYLSAGDGSWRVGGEFTKAVVRPNEPLAAFQLPPDRPIDPDIVVEASGSAFVGVAVGGALDDRPVTQTLEELLNYVQFQVIGRLEPFVR